MALGIQLRSDCVGPTPVTWGETIAGIFGNKNAAKVINDGTGNKTTIELSKEKTISILVLGFLIAVPAIVISLVAISLLFSVPVVAPLAAAAISAASMSGFLSSAPLMVGAIVAGFVGITTLIFGSAAANACCRAHNPAHGRGLFPQDNHPDDRTL